MRDDLYVLSRAERRQAIADWRDVASRERLEAVRRAKKGLAATDPRVSAAARGYGRYLSCATAPTASRARSSPSPVRP